MAHASPAQLEDQQFLVEEATGFVAELRFQLRKAIQANDLELALRCALRLASELRCNRLLPENYYKLYMLVFWELQHLAVFVGSTDLHGLSMEEVYELVQYEGSILPRLYLLVTVGAVYMRLPDVDPAKIFTDLLSLLTAVQHPARGLFLRYYLLQMTKEKLAERLDIRTVLQFILANFRESARLWARLRHEDPRARLPEAQAVFSTEEVWGLDRRRCCLRLLVGSHLMHIARLASMSLELHQEIVLPEALKRSTTCEDPPGRAYLLDCLIQVFPDRYHLVTLQQVLAACAEVHAVIDLRALLQRLMRRLTKYVKEMEDSSEPVPEGQDTFKLFHEHLLLLHRWPRSPATPLASLLELQLELLMVALALHPGDVGRVDLVLAGTVQLLQQHQQQSQLQQQPQEAPSASPALDAKSVASVVNILAAPLTQEQLVPPTLAMPHHRSLIGALDHKARRTAAVAMVSALLAGDVGLSDVETLERLFALIDPLIHDEDADDSTESPAEKLQQFDPIVFAAEQEKTASLAHQVRHEQADTAFHMLGVVRRYFGEGGPHRIPFTLPTTALSALRLVEPLLGQKCRADEGSGAPMPTASLDDVFQFTHGICIGVSSLRPEESLPLWLLCASTANRADQVMGSLGTLSPTCSRFINGALACLECDIRGQKAQYKGLSLVVGTLHNITCLQADAYEAAADRTVHFGSKLATRRLQSQAHCLCSHLYWSPRCHDPHRVLTCLVKALRLADGAVHGSASEIDLFMDILDKGVHLFEAGNEEITAPFLAGLLTLCTSHLKYVGSRAPPEARRALLSAVSHLKAKAADPRYEMLRQVALKLELPKA